MRTVELDGEVWTAAVDLLRERGVLPKNCPASHYILNMPAGHVRRATRKLAPGLFGPGRTGGVLLLVSETGRRLIEEDRVPRHTPAIAWAAKDRHNANRRAANAAAGKRTRQRKTTADRERGNATWAASELPSRWV